MILHEIREKVRILKTYYPGYSAHQILKQLKVVTNFLDDTNEDEMPEGCYYILDNVKFVSINSSLPEHEYSRVYAHELAHVLFHPYVNTLRLEDYDKVFVRKLEIQADMFCCEFLLDDNIFDEYEGVPNEKIAIAKGVTTELVELKFNNLQKLNLIDTNSYSAI